MSEQTAIVTRPERQDEQSPLVVLQARADEDMPDTRRNQMKLINEKWEDLNGRKHKLYVVRSMGAGRGFGVIEVLRNVVVATGWTREECYEHLRTTDVR